MSVRIVLENNGNEVGALVLSNAQATRLLKSFGDRGSDGEWVQATPAEVLTRIKGFISFRVRAWTQNENERQNQELINTELTNEGWTYE